MYTCSTCKETTNYAVCFAKRVKKDGTITRYYHCNPCNTARIKKYYHKNPKKVYNIIQRSISKHQYKQDARKLLNVAVQEGRVEKPKRCTNCNKRGRIEGHHDDYTQPLNVLWLCTSCHSDHHKEHRTSVVL